MGDKNQNKWDIIIFSNYFFCKIRVTYLSEKVREYGVCEYVIYLISRSIIIEINYIFI